MRDRARRLWGCGLLLAAHALIAPAAWAEVVTRTESGFVIRLASEVTAPPAEVWKTLLQPAQWWQSQHTFSGEAANLTLDPQVGGCFCEVLPRPEGAPPAQKPGGVQHMRVIYIEPPRAMRLVGALGPLQSEALAATLTITVKPTEKGSRVLFEYVVGGFMRYKVDEIAPAVDRVLAAQLTSLAGMLGPIAEAAPAKGGAIAGPPVPVGERPADEPAAALIVPLSGAETYRLPPAGGKADNRTKPAAKPTPKPATKPEPKDEPKANPAPMPAAAKPAVLLKPVPKAPARAAPKPAPKPSVKSAARAPDPEVDAHRDANAAFDAALSGAAPVP